MAQINLPSSYYMYVKLLGFKERESILYVHISRLWWFNSNINVTVFKKINIITAHKRSLGKVMLLHLFVCSQGEGVL